MKYFNDHEINMLLSEFSDDIYYNSRQIKAIIDTKYTIAFERFLGSGIEAYDYILTCKSSDVADIQHDDEILINNEPFYVKQIEKTTHGITYLYVSRDR